MLFFPITVTITHLQSDGCQAALLGGFEDLARSAALDRSAQQTIRMNHNFTRTLLEMSHHFIIIFPFLTSSPHLCGFGHVGHVDFAGSPHSVPLGSWTFVHLHHHHQTSGPIASAITIITGWTVDSVPEPGFRAVHSDVVASFQAGVKSRLKKKEPKKTNIK